MEVVNRFSSSVDRRDQGPNRELAEEIARTQKIDWIEDIFTVLASEPKKPIERDGLLVLAALGEFDPGLLAPYAEKLFPFLKSKANISIWSAMISLGAIAPYRLSLMMENLTLILDAMDCGSIIAKDHGFVILTNLYKSKEYHEDAYPLILEQIHSAPDNQLGQYAEKFMKVMKTEHKDDFEAVLRSRQPYLEKEAHRKRLAKIINKLWKI